MFESKLITKADLPNFLNNIRRLVDGSISINGLIIKPNGFITNVPKVILREAPVTPSGNTGVGEDAIAAFNIPGGFLPKNLDYSEGELSGGLANNTNTKTIRFYVNSGLQAVLVVNSGLQGWRLNFKIIRVSDIVVRVSCTLEANVLRINSLGVVTTSTGYAIQVNNSGDLGVSDLDTNNLDILVTAEAVNDNDITKNLTVLSICQQ